MKVYAIPGLGYDCRIFSGLTLDVMPEFINWIPHLPDEKFKDYTRRLFHHLPQDDDGIVLIGHSFGGVVAQEIASMKRIRKIILISSIKSRAEIPTSFKILHRLRLYKLFTKQLCTRTVRFWGKHHGMKDTSTIELFKSMLSKHSNHDLQSALRMLCTWEPTPMKNGTSIFQLHGTKDATLPFRFIDNADEVIDGGSHMMVFNQAARISWVVNRELGKSE